eukprot:2526154-Rhodomonas_salina.2
MLCQYSLSSGSGFAHLISHCRISDAWILRSGMALPGQGARPLHVPMQLRTSTGPYCMRYVVLMSGTSVPGKSYGGRKGTGWSVSESGRSLGDLRYEPRPVLCEARYEPRPSPWSIVAA